MATARLVASAYALSNTSYFSVTYPERAYNNTDNTDYATFRTTSNSTSSRYVYLKGFNFSDIPSSANVSSFSVKIKLYGTGLSSSAAYPCLCNNTSAISNTSTTTRPSTTVQTITIPTGSLTWDTIKNTYGSNFAIRIDARRSSRNTASYLYIYGAEIEVTYTIPVYHDVTVTNSTTATVSPTGTTSVLEGEDFVVSTNTLSGITVTDNGANVTSQFTQAQGGTVSATPGSTFTTGFSSSSGNFYQDSSTTSTSWLEYAIGHSAESPYSTSNTNNTYVKPEGSTGWINYHFDFSDIPLSATIDSVSVKVYGAREDSTIDSTHVARFQCYSGSTAKGTIQNFTSTSNGSVTVSNVGTWTASELHDAQLRFELGYYGGRMLGITWTVTYSVSGYVYTITNVAADHTIVVTSSAPAVHVTGVSLNKNSTSIVEGSTEQLTATVTPSNATDKSVTWSSSNTSVATVSNGLVTAVSAGTATITVTTTDGGYTATCLVTVPQPALTQYRLTNTATPGKDYLIANGNSGSVYLLSNESGGSRTLKGVPVTVTDGIVSITDAVASKCLFSLDLTQSGNSVTTGWSINGQYLYCDNANGLRMNAPTTLDRFWHYNDNKFWQFKSTSSDGYSDASSEYKYYLTWSNGNATDSHVDTTSIEDSNIPLTYIFEEYTPGTSECYVKINGSWVQASTVYKKVSGSWQEVSPDQAFTQGVNYKTVNV